MTTTITTASAADLYHTRPFDHENYYYSEDDTISDATVTSCPIQKELGPKILISEDYHLNNDWLDEIEHSFENNYTLDPEFCQPYTIVQSYLEPVATAATAANNKTYTVINNSYNSNNSKPNHSKLSVLKSRVKRVFKFSDNSSINSVKKQQEKIIMQSSLPVFPAFQPPRWHHSSPSPFPSISTATATNSNVSLGSSTPTVNNSIIDDFGYYPSPRTAAKDTESVYSVPCRRSCGISFKQHKKTSASSRNNHAAAATSPAILSHNSSTSTVTSSNRFKERFSLGNKQERVVTIQGILKKPPSPPVTSQLHFSHPSNNHTRVKTSSIIYNNNKDANEKKTRWSSSFMNPKRNSVLSHMMTRKKKEQQPLGTHHQEAKEEKEGTGRTTIRFDKFVHLHETYSKSQYDRQSDPDAVCTRLTATLAQQIKQELNNFKLHEMLVHDSSRIHTHFFL